MAEDKQEKSELKEGEMDLPIFTVQNKQEQTETELKSEEMVPVFTVLKNNAILKNIFLLDKPPSIPLPSSSSSIESNFQYEKESTKEETLLVGRHPDCNITLEHPSISRFHLRIHSNPSSRSLSVVDLYSVHGTWISGQKIVPGVMVELKEGDTMQLGGSRRLYRLHWVPIARAYDLDNPFVPPLDTRTTDAVQETGQDTRLDEDNLEGLQLLFADENLISSVQKMSPLDDEDVENKKSFEIDHEENMLDVSKIENSVLSEVQLEKSSSGSSIWFRRGKPAGVEIQVSQSRQRSARININSAVKSPICEHLQNKSVLQEPCAIDDVISKPIFTPDDENEEIFTPDYSQGKSPIRGYSQSESVSEDPFARGDSVRKQIFTPDKENCSSGSLIKSLEKKGLENSRIDSALRALFSCVDEEEEIFTPDKENMTPNTHRQRQMKKMSKLKEVENPKSYISSPLKKVDHFGMYKGNSRSDLTSSSLFSRVDEDEEEIFTPDKENMTPNTLRLRHTKNLGKLTEDEHPKSYRSSSLMTVVDLKAKSDRKPFQHLVVKSRDIFDATVHSFKNKTIKEEDNRWTMAVDISCLLNKKSRKELQLLRGLKGTSLIIPRIVIRELDCMLRRANFFRRTTEVSAALEWIEECVEKSEGWIHVQSLTEERRPVAPTPPASPLSWFYEEKSLFSISSSPFSPCTIQDIVTPTAEDHILECALFFKRLRNYGRFVLLSDDVTLKIKAMSEGVICETAREFRDSLVNPFSGRFLYKDSSPRGPTWTCADDVVLKEKYNSGDWKKLSKSGEGGAKGLKLVLLHNSNFTKISSIR